MVGTFPDGNSALMLVCARLRHVAGTQWGNKKYMNMKHLEAALEDVSIACCPHSAGVCKPILRITLDSTESLLQRSREENKIPIKCDESYNLHPKQNERAIRKTKAPNSKTKARQSFCYAPTGDSGCIFSMRFLR